MIIRKRGVNLIKAIIAGAYGVFTESLITRLKKESCEIFVVTGSKLPEVSKHKGVIEEYSFEYDNSNIPFIMESTKADALVFTGAMDSRFLWDRQSDAVAYISGLYNMLISASEAGVKRFIYISTTDVYHTVSSGTIDEKNPTAASELRTLTIKNGEDIAVQHGYDSGMEVIVLRCSEVYDFYNDKVNMHSFCTKLSFELITENVDVVYIDKYKKHDYIHLGDVVEAVYKTIKADHIPHSVYNICSGCGITEEQTLQLALKYIGITREVKFIGDTPQMSTEFSCELAREELGFTIKYSFEAGFMQFIKQLKGYDLTGQTNIKKQTIFRQLRKNIRSILKWFFPYFETIIAFFVVQFIVVTVGQTVFLKELDFYLLFVVFIAVIYGKGQTIITLLLCFIGKIVLMKGVSINDIVVDYNTYLWVLQLLTIGMGIGYIRDWYKQSIDDKQEEIDYLKAEFTEIKDINHSNIRIKKIYENRLINYQDSFARIYSIISKLDDLEPDKIMFAAVDVVSQIMNSNDITIYSVDRGSAFARLTASSTKMKYAVKKSIQLGTLGEVYDQIRERKIFINRSLDSDKPSMAGGIYHEDRLEAVIIIWSLPFENISLYHMNLFSVVINLIAQALHRAIYHIGTSRSSRYLENTSILTPNAFKKIIDIKKHGSDTKLAEYYILEILRYDRPLKEINDIIVQILRQQDYLGLGEDGRLYSILTNTNENEAECVINRISSKGIETRKGTLEYHAS